jgi:hypothetical protein
MFVEQYITLFTLEPQTYMLVHIVELFKTNPTIPNTPYFQKIKLDASGIKVTSWYMLKIDKFLPSSIMCIHRHVYTITAVDALNGCLPIWMYGVNMQNWNLLNNWIELY